MTEVMPMLAKAGDLPEGPGWSYEPKYDGNRMFGQSDGRIFIGRNKAEITGLPYIADALKQLPPGTILDGELISPNDWGGVARVVKKLQGNMDVHVPSEELPALQFVVFDVIEWARADFTSTPFGERRIALEQSSIPPGTDGPLFLTGQYIGDDPQAYFESMVEDGWEGIMAKHDDGLYHTGRIDSKGNPKSQRASLKEMVKLKVQDTVDVIVTAVYPPEEGSWLEDEGLPGRLGYAFADGAEAGLVGTGFSREDRQHIRDNEDEWVGHVIEIGHMTVADDAEKLRHPSFIRRRDDKKPADATKKEDA